MSIQQMACPNCGGTISLAEDMDRFNCAYCGSALTVQRGEGYAVLKTAQKIEKAIRDTSAQTQGTIREGTQVTQVELKRLQINQNITTAQLQLTNIQAEIRSLERGNATKTTKQQLQELRRQEASVRSRMDALNAALLPFGSSAIPSRTAPTPQMTWRTGCGWAILVFFVSGVILVGAMSSASSDAQCVGAVLALAAGLGFYFFYRNRKKRQMSK